MKINNMKINNIIFKSGDEINCRINGNVIIDAHIYIKSDNYRGYICHDNSNCKGGESPDLLGHRYSWAFHIEDNPDGTTYTSDGISHLEHLLSISRKENVLYPDFQLFIESNNFKFLNRLFSYKLGIFEDFNIYKKSNIPGIIILSSSINKDKKELDIKFTRFLRKLIIEYNKIDIKNSINIDDAFIENFHNKYVSFQNEQNMELEFLSGEQILEGYKYSNYASGNSTLHKSCMTDKLYFLDLYTKNPNQVQLAIIKINNKIAARALVWTTTENIKVVDRPYYANDWLNNFIIDKCREQNIIDINELGYGIVNLENYQFSSYPYLDNFFYLDKITGNLHYINPVKIINLRSTNG